MTAAIDGATPAPRPSERPVLERLDCIARTRCLNVIAVLGHHAGDDAPFLDCRGCGAYAAIVDREQLAADVSGLASIAAAVIGGEMRRNGVSATVTRRSPPAPATTPPTKRRVIALVGEAPATYDTRELAAAVVAQARNGTERASVMKVVRQMVFRGELVVRDGRLTLGAEVAR